MIFKKLSLILLIVILASEFSGCVSPEKLKQMLFMKDLADNQKAMAQSLAQQKELFYELKKDITEGELKKKRSKHRIVFRYGEPIFCKEVIDKAGVTECCIYRNPGQGLVADMIYLYFDKNGKLVSGEFIPGEN